MDGERARRASAGGTPGRLALGNPFSVFHVLWGHRFLIGRLVWRDVLQRYRGSTFGLLWSLFNPILMLAVFTFVFSQVFGARWQRDGCGPAG